MKTFIKNLGTKDLLILISFILIAIAFSFFLVFLDERPIEKFYHLFLIILFSFWIRKIIYNALPEN